MLAVSIESVTTDIREMVTTGKYPVVMLLRGYGLLELLEDYYGRGGSDCQDIGKALSEYRMVYEEYGERLEGLLSREEIKSKSEAYMRPWQRKLDEAQRAYKKSVELWEAAKAAHQAQVQGGGGVAGIGKGCPVTEGAQATSSATGSKDANIPTFGTIGTSLFA